METMETGNTNNHNDITLVDDIIASMEMAKIKLSSVIEPSLRDQPKKS